MDLIQEQMKQPLCHKFVKYGYCSTGLLCKYCHIPFGYTVKGMNNFGVSLLNDENWSIEGYLKEMNDYYDHLKRTETTLKYEIPYEIKKLGRNIPPSLKIPSNQRYDFSIENVAHWG